MSSLSNNHLAVLLVLTALVIVAGTFFSLNKISVIKKGVPITGAATGTVSVTVASTTYITVSGAISLGALEPGSWNSSENSSYFGGGGNWNNTNVTANFTVKNDGSVPINIEVYDFNQTAATAGRGAFIGSSGCVAANTCYMVRCGYVDNNGSSGTQCNDGKGTYTAVPVTAGTTFATKVNYTDTKDKAYFFINLSVPNDEPPINLTQTLTFAASASP